jgi:hypothetical protein
MNGVDTSIFRPMDKARQKEILNLRVNRIVLLFVGGIVAVKGLNYLIEAAGVLRQLHGNRFLLIIVGEGYMERYLRDMVRSSDLDGQVRFVGKVPNDQIPVWMNAADFFILPSLDEGTPNTVLEALSCGVPVLASRVGGTLDLIEDFTSAEGKIPLLDIKAGEHKLCVEYHLAGAKTETEEMTFQFKGKVEEAFIKLLPGDGAKVYDHRSVLIAYFDLDIKDKVAEVKMLLDEEDITDLAMVYSDGLFFLPQEIYTKGEHIFKVVVTLSDGRVIEGESAFTILSMDEEEEE